MWTFVGAKGEEGDHLQAGRVLRQRVPKEGKGGDQVEASGAKQGRILRPRRTQGLLRHPFKGVGRFAPAVRVAFLTGTTDSINNIAPKPRKILQLLRLLQINNGVFIKVTKATSQMLQLVQPYIAYGFVHSQTRFASHREPDP